MSSSKGLVQGSGSAGASTGGRRSASFEKHRRQNSSSGRSHSRSASGASGSGHAVAGYVRGVAGASGAAPVVPPPPKERLLPSPPLTPVASLSSLRKAGNGAGGAGRERADVEAMPKSGKFNNASLKGVAASDRSDPVDGSASVAGGGVGGATGADGERDTTVEDGLDTERDGTMSFSSSYRPDGTTTSTEAGTITNATTTTTTTTDTATSTDGCGTEDNNAGLALPFTSATTTTTTAPVPLSHSGLGEKFEYDDVSQGPLERDPLGANGSGTGDAETGASNVFPQGTATSSSSMPPDHEATSPPHPLYNGPSSPQPWDLVEPPPNNNEDIMRRMRKESNRSMRGPMVDVVVKDGKKYRIPHSSYYFGPPPDTSAFGTHPIGHIGVHHPREIIRIERDYSAGDLAQFSPAYPLEIEGRITPTQFLETINAINETLLDAHSLRWSFLDNTLAILTLYVSRLFIESNYDRKMRRLKELIEKMNKERYNPVGLNILWPKDVAFMFLEIEYY